MSPHVLDVWENHCTCMTDAGAVTGWGMVSLPCGACEKCVEISKTAENVDVLVRPSFDKNEKHV